MTNKKKTLYLFLTTTQSPHLEAMFHFAAENRRLYEDIVMIDFIKHLKYRHEYTWRSYLPMSLNISRKFRNGILKNLIKDINIKNYKNIKLQSEIVNECCLTDDQIYAIIKTYSATEFKTSGIVLNKYTEKIKSTILFVSKAIDNLTEMYDFHQSDVVIFNGRLPVENAIIKSLLHKSSPNLIYHECNNFQHKIYFSKSSPHDLNAFSSQIISYASSIDAVKKYRKYRPMISGEGRRSYISFFTSSNDEFLFFYPKPIDQSKIIFGLLNKDFGVPLKIRIHPNTSGKSIESRAYFDRLKKLYPKAIINYDEECSSYELIRNSYLTVSIGSSIAAESTIMGVPHLLIGAQNYYFSLGFCLKACEEDYLDKISEHLDMLKINPNMYSEQCRLAQNIAAAAIMCEKELGTPLRPWLLGAYPTPHSEF